MKPRALPVLMALAWLTNFAVYALYFQGQWVFGERPIYSITGDEPHYLTIATSLVSDGDLDVLDEYRDKEYFPYYPFHLGDARDPEDMHAIYGRGGALYSKHGVGLPLVIAPAMRLGGHGWATVMMLVVAATLSLQILRLALDTARARWAALAAWVGVAFSPPLLLYAPLFYPEMPGALLAVWGARRALRFVRSGRGLSLTTLGIACGLLPWLHLRYVPIAAALGFAGVLAVVLRRRGTRATLTGLAALVVPAALLGALLWLLNWRLFGGIPSVDEYGAVALRRFVTGAPGLLFDRQFGLLPYAPLFLLVPLGAATAIRRLGGVAALVVFGPVVAYAAFVACFSYWYGAFSPPARMLVPVVPLLVVPLAVAVERWRLARPVAAVLFVATAAIAHLLMDVPRLRYNLPTGASAALEYLSAVWQRDLTRWLPSFITPDATTYVWMGGALLALSIAYALLVLPDVRRAP